VTSADDDPRCPECGEPIGQTATYCMHCSADLTEELEAADADDDGAWDESDPVSAPNDDGFVSVGDDSGSEAGTTANTGTAANAGSARGTVDEAEGTVSSPTAGGADTGPSEQLLDPDGLVDNTLTVAVGIAGGIVVGLMGTTVLGFITGSAWALLFGFVAWLGSTAYLVRRRTVQGAVAKSGYAVAVVLMLTPLIALSPAVDIDGGLAERGSTFLLLLVFSAFPAGIAAAVGWIASRFVPEGAGQGPA